MSSTKVTKLVDFSDLYLEGNVRTEACEAIPQMVQSLRRNGFKPNHPLVVSERDGRFLVLCGNRRKKGLDWLAENDDSEYRRILGEFNGKIPCIVHKGLTEEEEILLRVDHSTDEDRVGLDEWSQFLAIKQLVRAFTAESQERIAEKLGIFHNKGKNKGKPNRSYVQTRVDLARLPVFVQEEIRKLMQEGKDATPVRISDIKKLKTVYNDEYADYPDGDGPEFKKAWEGIVNPEPKAESADGDKVEPADLSVKSAFERSQACSSRLLGRVLLAVTNQGKDDLVALDAQVLQAETDSQILADIAEYLGENDYAQLVDAARNARVEREAQDAENAETADSAE
jgi:hypothetical protein